MVYTVRFAGIGRRGGRTMLEHELRRLGILQKNSRPNHPTTCGKVERFQQTLKKWLRAQPDQPSTIAELQALLDALRRGVQPAATAPLPAAPGDPSHRLHSPPQGHTRHRPQHRHPRPRPDRQRQQIRKRHPALQRAPAPHRHRPDLRRNLRPTPRRGPPHPRRPRHHRRAPPGADPRPEPRLPTDRPATRTHPKANTRPYENVGPGVLDVLRHHMVAGAGFEPATSGL